MKRLIIFLFILIVFVGIYNFSVLRGSLYGFFGDNSYRKGDFPDADQRYKDILENGSGSTLLTADTLYNLGNTLYRLGDKEKDEGKLKLWEKAVENYTKSLSLRTDKQTEENLAFVQDKLKKEKEKQEQKKKEEEDTGTGANRKQEQSKTQSGTTQEKEGEQKDDKNAQPWKEGNATKNDTDNNKKETSSWSENKQANPQPGQNWSNQWSYNPLGGQSKDNADSKLSDADKQSLQQYMDGLKQFQKQNGKLLNPHNPGGNAGGLSEQIRNFFGSDSFFQDVIPSDDGKKDW